MILLRTTAVASLLILASCRVGYESSDSPADDLLGEGGAVAVASGAGTGPGGEGPGGSPSGGSGTSVGGGVGGTQSADGGNSSTGGNASTGGTSAGGSATSGGSAGVGGDVSTGGSPDGSGGTGGGASGPLDFSLEGFVATGRQGTDTANQVSDECPVDQVVIGYDGWIGGKQLVVGGKPTWVTLLTAVQAICGTPQVVGEGPYSIEIGPGLTLPALGNPGGGHQPEPFSARCPANEAIIEFRGRTGLGVDRLGWSCGSMTTDGSSVDVAITTILPEFGGDGGSIFAGGCAAGSVARGVDLTDDGEFLASYGMICGAPMVTPL